MATEEATLEEELSEPPRSMNARRRSGKGLLVIAIGVSAVFIVLAVTLGVSREIKHPTPLFDAASTTVRKVDDPTEVTSMEKVRDLAPIERRLEVLSEWLTQRLGKLEINRKSLRADLAAIARRDAEILDSMTMLTEAGLDIGLQLNAMQSRLESLAADIHKLKEKPRPKPRRTVTTPTKPPFHVDAIDRWDNAIHVALSQNGRVAFLKEGESQSGWTLLRIDPRKEIVTFQGPKGQSHTVTAGR